MDFDLIDNLNTVDVLDKYDEILTQSDTLSFTCWCIGCFSRTYRQYCMGVEDPSSTNLYGLKSNDDCKSFCKRFSCGTPSSAFVNDYYGARYGHDYAAYC